MPLFVGFLALVAAIFLPSSDVLSVQEGDQVLMYDNLYVYADPIQSEIDNIPVGVPSVIDEKTAKIAYVSMSANDRKNFTNENRQIEADSRNCHDTWNFTRSMDNVACEKNKADMELLEAKIKTETSPEQIIREVAINSKCSESEITMLLEIARKESSFDVKARSPGGNCIGLFQLSSDKGSYAQRVDPYWNTSTAISYMKDRYGSIQSAYAFRRAHSWY